MALVNEVTTVELLDRWNEFRTADRISRFFKDRVEARLKRPDVSLTNQRNPIVCCGACECGTNSKLVRQKWS